MVKYLVDAGNEDALDCIKVAPDVVKFRVGNNSFRVAVTLATQDRSDRGGVGPVKSANPGYASLV